jgi:predicted nucleotidyltransferase
MSNMLLKKKIKNPEDKAMNILMEFSSDYYGRIYGRQIAKKLKMNQKTVSNILNKLEKEHILKFSTEGKNKYYYLNRFNKKIREIIKLIEINKKIKFLEHSSLKELFNKLEQRSRGILIVFGSYAKNQATKKSDLDVFIMGEIQDVKDLEGLYNIKINIVKSSKEKFNKQDTFIKEIIKNHVILKGMEDFVDLLKTF